MTSEASAGKDVGCLFGLFGADPNKKTPDVFSEFRLRALLW